VAFTWIEMGQWSDNQLTSAQWSDYVADTVLIPKDIVIVYNVTWCEYVCVYVCMTVCMYVCVCVCFT